MLTALSTLTALETLQLEFEPPRFHLEQEIQRPPLPTHFVLPVLTYFEFKGVSDYLGDLMSGIDAPQLSYLSIIFFNQVVFDTPELIQFISYNTFVESTPKSQPHLENGVDHVNLKSKTSRYQGQLNVKILCREVDWQNLSLEQVCTVALASPSHAGRPLHDRGSMLTIRLAR